MKKVGFRMLIIHSGFIIWFAVFGTLTCWADSWHCDSDSYSSTSITDHYPVSAPANKYNVMNSCFFVKADLLQAEDDSLKKKSDIQAERKRLRKEIDSLTKRLSELQTKAAQEQQPAESLRSQIVQTEKRIKSLEDNLAKLSEKPSKGPDDTESEVTESMEQEESTDEWDLFESDEDDEWTIQEEESDEQFEIRRKFYRKSPGDFVWPFPVETVLGETFIRYNRVEGFYLGLAHEKRVYWHSQPKVVTSGSLGYGFASHRWRYGLGVYFPIYLKNQIIELGAEGHSYTDSKDQWLVNVNENSAMAFLAREDFMDYFSREGFSASGAWHYRGLGSLNIRGTIAYVHDTYSNMLRRTNWSLFGGDKNFRIQPQINPGNINSLVFSAAMTSYKTPTDRRKGWDIQLSYETSGGFMKGDYEFTQVIFDLRRYQPITDFLNFNVRFRGGASDGNLPIQRSFDLGGISTLPGYRFKEFSGSHSALINAEAIVRIKFANLIVFSDAGTTNSPTDLISRDFTNGAMEASFSDGFKFNSLKTDIGVAAGSEDGNFRIGVAWRLDRSESPNFILRFSRPF